MRSNNTEWNRAARGAFEAYESALRTGAEKDWAVVIALTQMRAIVSNVTESDVRQALSIMLAEKRLSERTAARPAHVTASAEEQV
jgi:hypothetical protein